MPAGEVKNVIDICNARIDYNTALIETANSLTTDKERREFYIEVMVSAVGSDELRGYLHLAVQRLSPSYLNHSLISAAEGDIGDYKQILTWLEQDNFNLFAATVLAKGFYNCELQQNTLHQFTREDYDSDDKFEVYVVKDILERLTSCLNEQERVFLRCISFVNRTKGQCFFSNDIFNSWLDEMLHELRIALVSKSFSAFTTEEEGRVQELMCELDAIKGWANSLGFGMSILDESRAFQNFHDELKIKIDCLANKISGLEDAAPIKSKSKSKKSAKQRKKTSKNKITSGNADNGDCEAIDLPTKDIASPDPILERDIEDSLDASFSDSQIGLNRKIIKENKRNEYKRHIEERAFRKQKKEEARSDAESLRHEGRISSIQYMRSMYDDRSAEESNDDVDSLDFVLSKETIRKSLKELKELFDPNLKNVSFSFAQKLILKLGGSLKNNNGGSHYGVMFAQRLKGYVKESVVGGIARPHGRAGSDISGFNLRLLKKAISKVLPADWLSMELSPTQNDDNSSSFVLASKLSI